MKVRNDLYLLRTLSDVFIGRYFLLDFWILDLIVIVTSNIFSINEAPGSLSLFLKNNPES